MANLKNYYKELKKFKDIIIPSIMDALNAEGIQYSKNSESPTELTISDDSFSEDWLYNALEEIPSNMISGLVDIIKFDGNYHIRLRIK